MDSPYIAPGMAESTHQVSILRDDSGYVTVTPSSAECTRMSSDVSGNLSIRTPFLSHNISDSRHDLTSSFNLSTPEDVLVVNSRRGYTHKAKVLFAETSSSVDSFTESNVIDKHSAKILAPVQEDLYCLTQKVHKPCLKRQLAVSDDSEWCEEPFSGNHLSSKLELDRYADQLQKLEVTKDTNSPLLSVQSPVFPMDLTQRCANSDPRDYNKSLVSLNQYNLFTSNKENLDSNKPYAQYTPRKSIKKFKRSTPEDFSHHRSSTTLERHSACSSECHSSESKIVKKLDFDSQKLGSPEKYQLLYPKLKPVTPPKKLKLSKIESPKCKKRLEMPKKTFIGRETVDFLGLLRSYGPATKKILKELSDNDLINIYNVSRSWRKVCKEDREAEMRRCRAVRRNEKNKENNNLVKPNIAIKGKKLLSSQSVNHNMLRNHLSEIQNHGNIMTQSTPKTISPPVSPSKRRFNMYVKAASEDSMSQLRSCPKCTRPARVRDHWAKCGGPNCGYYFCIKCLSEKISGSKCCQNQVEPPSPSKQVLSRHGIGSKKSKRYLKRL